MDISLTVSRQHSQPKAMTLSTSVSENLTGTGPKGFMAFMDQEVPMLYDPLTIVFASESPSSSKESAQKI